MRRRLRVALLALGVLLLAGAAYGVFLPYVNRLVYPQLLSKIEPSHTVTSADFPDPRVGRIDELGAADRVRSEADARVYVDALVEKWGPDEKDLPDREQFKDRLARAEYAAIRDPQKRIPESLVAKTFNGLMDEWQMSAWTWPRISVEELHAFRIVESSAVYSRSVARLPDGSIAPDCRPTEALLLLDFLNFNGGVQPWLRERVRARHFPWNLLKRYEWRRPSQHKRSGPVKYELQAVGPEFFRRPEFVQADKFDKARQKYFANHPGFTSQQLANNLFAKLGIS